MAASQGEAPNASPNVNDDMTQMTLADTNQPTQGNAQGSATGQKPQDNNTQKIPPGDKPDSQEDKTTKAQGTTEAPKATSAPCKPIATERPKIELPSHRINAQIQYMRDHALIGKFIGMWPTEKALHGWIAAKWKPKGHITLHLGPKGFFTDIFNWLED